MPLMVSGVFFLLLRCQPTFQDQRRSAVELFVSPLDTSSKRQAVDIFCLGQGPMHENSVGRIILQSKIFGL